MGEQIQEPPQNIITQQALLQHLIDSEDVTWYSYWLAYLKQLVHLDAALVLADYRLDGQLEAVALWPEKTEHLNALHNAAREAYDEQQPVIAPSDDQRFMAALPVRQKEQMVAVVAVMLPMQTEDQLQQVLTRLEWATTALELKALRVLSEKHAELSAQQTILLEGFNTVLEQRDFPAAALATVNLLAREMQCDRVMLAYLDQGVIRVAAQSDAAEQKDRMNTQRLSVKAMQETVEQLESVSWPPRQDRDQVTLAHRELSEYIGQSSVLSVPLLDREFCYGVLLFERAIQQPFSDMDRVRCESFGSIVGLALEQKRQAQLPLYKIIGATLRSKLETFLMPGYLGRKLTVIFSTFLFLFFAFYRSEYHLAADAVLEGAEIRSVVVPFDGFLERAPVRAGDLVVKDSEVATLDTRELRLQRIKWLSEQGQAKRQYEDALARQDRAKVKIFLAQMDRAGAELDLIEYQLEQAAMKAPFDAVVVSGDQSQQIGSSVRQGDVLFELAPDNRYRLALYIDEFRINDIEKGQTGQLVLAALPQHTFDVEIKQITYLAETRDSQSVYRVEAELASTIDALRPGLEGVAKIYIDDRLLISIWTRALRDWVTLQWWRIWG